MFNTLFHYPRVLARHRQGPSAQARERYLTHCADQGAYGRTFPGRARPSQVRKQAALFVDRSNRHWIVRDAAIRTSSL